MFFDSAFDLVGNTPVVRLGTHRNATLWAKLEGQNPTGSLKDRTASAFVKTGIEKFGTSREFIDASSGSFACALAYFSRVAGAKCTVVVNSKISDDNLAFLQTQKATIIRHGEVTGESREKCLSVVREDPSHWIFTDQLTNVEAANIHETSTAPEILKERNVAAVIGSKGSGATLCGITRYVQKHNLRTKVFGAVGIPGDVKKIAGTYVEGTDFVSRFIEELEDAPSYEDIAVTFEEAMTNCVKINVLVGPQGGGVYTAALKAIEKHDIEGDVVLVMGDTLLKNVSRFT